tara:strand:+ start:115 stop:1161 length:1047 start_codon:yes stop_codon:yes gene_type:complete
VNKTLVILFSINIISSQPVLQEFYYGGIDRQYYLYIPASIQPESPLVFVFHGFMSSGESIMEYSGMNEIAETNSFAVCYPQGTTDNNGNTFFNVGYSFHWNQTVDDVGFVIALAEYLQTHFNLSSINTFSTGMSNGGEMSYLLACESSNHFRAVAPVAGTMMQSWYDTCDPDLPTPIFEIHGTIDNVTWWDGDLQDFGGWGPYMGVYDIIELWRNINLTESVVYDTLPDLNQEDGSYVITEKYQDGINSNEVWLYKVVGGAHDWPGAFGNMDFNASELVWQFFDRFLLSYTIGDVDYDGRININDILYISDAINDEISFNLLFDYNDDNAINMNDIYSIIATIFGLSS